ncbi:uncharacterized protein LOC113764844 isoform X1 [Coffea eugenioides]|uniref:Uncharacterized protein isoform X1 n=1 Tax=Coffea arabica TaxID=13443 RepID=A0A6P6UQN3_COFAR|nr:uncharacterized protein LOC113713192 isoform X1 [Coffea arabica]XP_027164666.1 uncharacterized protein LOC113764844 isoform X1 [Coffea eugenioides]
MAKTKYPSLLLLLIILFCTELLLVLQVTGVAGSRTPILARSNHLKATQMSSSQQELQFQTGGKGRMYKNSKRLMIGSVAPTCTYNECRGCKYKCSAEQVPVEGNDPIHSAYHYKCVCHR